MIIAHFTIRAELAAQATSEAVERIGDELSYFGGGAQTSSSGSIEAWMRIPADDMRNATLLAIAQLQQLAGAPVRRLEVEAAPV